MEWKKVKIITNRESLDALSDELAGIGIYGIEITDKDDFKEFLENNTKYWDYVDEKLEELKNADTAITLYLSEDEEGEEQFKALQTMLERLKAKGGFGSLEIITEDVRDEDWSENWKKYFKPLEVGEKILIQPEWQPAEKTDRIVFVINPGMSFGTGTHDSTRFCIEEVEKCLKKGDSVLDLGCGSGILSIIALLLGAERADAVDIDPNCIETAYSNLELNRIDRSRYSVVAGDITADAELRASFGKYDLVLANIVADVIIALAPYVRDFMKPDGKFICSGIINERRAEVEKALERSGLLIEEERSSDEWTVIRASAKE